MRVRNGRVRLLAVDGYEDTGDILRDLQRLEGYANMKEFVFRTIEYRYPEFKPFADEELREKRGRPRKEKKSVKH